MVDILADSIFKKIFMNENGRIQIQISLKVVPKSPIDNKSALVWVMAWGQRGNKPLPEPMLVHCQLDLREQNPLKFKSKYKTFNSWKYI